MENAPPAPTSQRPPRFRWWRNPLRFLALACVIIFVAAWWARGPRQPLVDGKRLSVWLYDTHHSHKAGYYSDEFGPDAVKWLAWAAEHGRVPHARARPAKPSKIAQAVDQLWRRLFHRNVDESYDERMAALACLENMGSGAGPAVPALARLLGSANQSYVEKAAQIFSNLGPSAVEEGFRTETLNGRCTLIRAVARRMYYVAPAIVDAETARFFDFFRKASQDPHPQVRVSVARNLQKATGEHYEPSLGHMALPILIPLLSDSQPDVRKAALEGLMMSPQEAAAAAPRLRELLTDPDLEVRENAGWLLDKIAPLERRAQAQAAGATVAKAIER